VYPGSRELREIEAVDADVVILGHTHVQMDERVGRVRVLNPGSVGDPRDPRNGRRGSCGVLDVGSGEFTVHDFDVALAG
jgi:predicted phosphodiesterase